MKSHLDPPEVSSINRSILRALVSTWPESCGCDDPGIADAITRHGLNGLAVQALESDLLDVSRVSAEKILLDWSRARLKSAVVDLEVLRIGGAFLDSFSGDGPSPAILLKGQAVASRYDDPSVRTYTDIDLLVVPAELEAWGAFLRSLGYAPESDWRERHQRLYDNHVVYRRRFSGGSISCEVHSRLCAKRSLMRFGYDPLAGSAEDGPVPGLMRLTTPAQIVALAVHLLHHSAEDRRLIWYRDFLELADQSEVREARSLAKRWGVDWVLEWTLCQVEELVGRSVWNAEPIVLEDKGLWKRLERDQKGLRFHLSIASEHSPLRGLGYLISKFNPKRFQDHDGQIRWSEIVSWAKRMSRLLALRKSRL